jgi:V/A-type H+-transporting ATPase subunit I
VAILRPVPMTKIGLVGLKDDRDVVLSVLHDAGVLQIEPLSKESLEYLEPERGGETVRRVSDELIRFRGLRAALPALPLTTPPRGYADLDRILAAADKVSIDEEVGRLAREEDRLTTERKSLTETIDLLARFSFYAAPLEYLYGENLLGFFGTAPAEEYPALRAEIGRISDALFVEGPVEEETVRFVVAVKLAQAEAVGRLAQQKGVTLVAAPRLKGAPAEVLPSLSGRLSQVDVRLGEIRARLTEISRTHYAAVLSLEEALAIENRKLEVLTRTGSGRSTFALEGWVPTRARAGLEATVREVTDGRAFVYPVPAAADEAPTLMDNPRGFRVFEFFIRFYSLPQSTEWDPTFVFALAFPIFFGLMLGDWGYGLTILGISLWMLAGFPGGGKLPRGLRNFVKLIMSPRAMQQLAAALIPGCAIAIGLGLYFNEFFGAPLLPWGSVNDPLHHVGTLIVIAGYIGLVMVSLGFLLGGLKDYFHHHPRHALARFGGIFFAWGVAEIGLQLIHLGTPGLSPGAYPLVGLYYALLVLGIALLVVGEKAQGFMALTEIVSHVLSYTRLIGILLASVVLALVINQIALGFPATYGIAGVVGAIGLLIIGQGFNVVLGVFEPGIQGARLIFVEHFSKYFTGNGRPFHPFGTRRVYTVAARGPPRPLVTSAGSTVPTVAQP